MRHIPASILIAEAASLISEHGENTEYDRGVAELTAFLLGETSEGIEAVLWSLRNHPQSNYEHKDKDIEPTEVTLTRLVQGIEHLIDGLAGGLVGPNAYPNMGLTLDDATNYDVRLRRSLWRVVGFAPCDELGETECGCDEDEPRPMTPESPCTGMWRGCSVCGHLCYAEGVGEYDVCKACHWDRRCLAPELNACSGTCDIYGDAA